MANHTVGTREEWRAARIRLLEAEKALTRQGDEVTKQRLALPWVRIEKGYEFDTEDGPVSLDELFRGRSQLLLHHFMFAPEWDEGCPMCSSVADGYDGIRVHLENHDVAMTTVSRAPIEKLLAYRKRMGWSFPWVSSARSSFNFDFGTSYTERQFAEGAEHNFRPFQIDVSQLPHQGTTDDPVEAAEAHAVSAFALQDGEVFHTYSSYARGQDALWGMFQWLDRAPLGRKEDTLSLKRHDSYDGPAGG